MTKRDMFQQQHPNDERSWNGLMSSSECSFHVVHKCRKYWTIHLRFIFELLLCASNQGLSNYSYSINHYVFECVFGKMSRSPGLHSIGGVEKITI